MSNINDSVFDDLMELIDDEDNEFVDASTSTDSISDAQRKLGGFQDMSSEEIEQFQQSQDYKEYKADIEEATDIAANMNGKTVQEIMGLSNRKDAIGYSYNALEHYDIDIDIYEDIVMQSPVMQATLEEGEDVLPTFRYLHQDIFLSLYKYKARVLPETQMHTSTRMNRGIIKNLINTPEYISLRQTCRMDQFNAALGTEIIGREALEILKQALENVKDLQKKKDAMDDLLEKEEQIDDLMEEIGDIDDLIEQAKQAGNGSYAAQLQAEKAAKEQAAAQLKAMANKIAQECDDLVEEDDLATQVSKTMGKTLDSASKEVQEVSDLCESWGLGTGENCHVAFQNKKDAIEVIRKSPKLNKLTDMIGRFKESAITEQKKKAKHGAVEIKSVTTGNKIQDTLPSDRMNLCNETTKKDFYRRMTEHQLMTYSKEAHKQKNKGPIIVCVDTSGSMSGDAEIWSKALTVGILEVAQMQKRDFACIIYDSSADEPIVIKKDEIAPQKIITCAERFRGGGTSFEAPLNKALDLIKDSTFKDADIVFITDGDCYTSDAFSRKFNQIKQEKEFKTLGVLVNIGYGHTSDSSLKEFCDDIALVSDIADLKDGDSAVNKAIFGNL
jgi:uncharacterized protein with von Willebrand factor type A (vWA) domain